MAIRRLIDRRSSTLKTGDKILAKRLLRLLDPDELKELFVHLTGEDMAEGSSREFMISRLQNTVDARNLLKNERVAPLIVDKISDVLAFIERTIGHLEREEIMRIYRDLTSEKLRKENSTKSEILEEILDKIPSVELIKNKRLLERMKPKYVSIADIRSLRDGIELLKKETSNASDDIGLLSDRIFSAEDFLKQALTRLKTMDEAFETTELPNLETFLKIMYDESIKIGERPTAESFHGLAERLRMQLGINERSFVLKGVELLLIHYLMSAARSLRWRPTLESFTEILKEEFEGKGPIKDRIDIPSLRTRISKRLAIEEEVFDDMVIEAWKKDLIKLEAGAPIGEFNVKYLVTRDGQKFYYIRLR